MIEPNGICSQMPFADDSRLVSSVLKQPWEGRLIPIKTISIPKKPINMRMLTRQNAGS